jgi:hypothetical protein
MFFSVGSRASFLTSCAMDAQGGAFGVAFQPTDVLDEVRAGAAGHENPSFSQIQFVYISLHGIY